MPLHTISMDMLSQVITNVMSDAIPIDQMVDVKEYDGIEESSINELKTLKLDKDSEDSCCICLNNFKKDEELINLPCNHIYHSFCIKKWFADSSNKCCICKTEYGKAKYIHNGVPDHI